MPPSLNAENKPSWSIRTAFKRLNHLLTRIEPEAESTGNTIIGSTVEIRNYKYMVSENNVAGGNNFYGVSGYDTNGYTIAGFYEATSSNANTILISQLDSSIPTVGGGGAGFDTIIDHRFGQYSAFGEGLSTSSLRGVIGILNGGTGSASQNFVDLTTDQQINGNKTFTGTIGRNVAIPTLPVDFVSATSGVQTEIVGIRSNGTSAGTGSCFKMANTTASTATDSSGAGTICVVRTNAPTSGNSTMLMTIFDNTDGALWSTNEIISYAGTVLGINLASSTVPSTTLEVIGTGSFTSNLAVGTTTTSTATLNDGGSLNVTQTSTMNALVSIAVNNASSALTITDGGSVANTQPLITGTLINTNDAGGVAKFSGGAKTTPILTVQNSGVRSLQSGDSIVLLQSTNGSDASGSVLQLKATGTAVPLYVPSGNSGFGTPTPSTTLQVVDSANNSSTIQIGAVGKFSCVKMTDASNTANLYYVFISNGVVTSTATKPNFCM